MYLLIYVFVYLGNPTVFKIQNHIERNIQKHVPHHHPSPQFPLAHHLYFISTHSIPRGNLSP